uniref:Uncharacterized protein n=1 Tax=Anopheles atroparvus TaxID=41427 RepID=A0A182IUX2_ANOAO
MKSNGAARPAVELSQTMGTGGHRRIASSTDTDSQQLRRLEMGQYQQRAPLARKSQQHQLFRSHRHHREQQQEQLHVVAKPKLIPRFTRFQVLRIIKLATMDKLRESSASGADDPTRQRLATEGAGGVDGGGGGGGDGGGRGAGGGNGGSDEYHHQFYNTGRIGRRNALPDILGTHCTTTTADLSSQLGALSTSECAGKPADASGVLGSSITPPPNSGQTPTTTGT